MLVERERRRARGQGAYKKGSGDLQFRAKNGLLWEVCA
jgi:hypothetical protein